MSQEASALLHERADIYGRDAARLRQAGNTDDASYLEAIRDELRLVAKSLSKESAE